MLTAKHNITDKESMLLPVSMFMHSEFENASTGDIIQFYDGTAEFMDCNAVPIRVIKRYGKIVGVVSRLGNQLSDYLYGYSLTSCYVLWKHNWNDISEDKLLFVTYTNAKKDE